jgi:outer membrane lipopolysaccharide assembly protein LptE/RlpB
MRINVLQRRGAAATALLALALTASLTGCGFAHRAATPPVQPPVSTQQAPAAESTPPPAPVASAAPSVSNSAAIAAAKAALEAATKSASSADAVAGQDLAKASSSPEGDPTQ